MGNQLTHALSECDSSIQVICGLDTDEVNNGLPVWDFMDHIEDEPDDSMCDWCAVAIVDKAKDMITRLY